MNADNQVVDGFGEKPLVENDIISVKSEEITEEVLADEIVKLNAEKRELEAEVERQKKHAGAVSLAGYNANVRLIKENQQLRNKLAAHEGAMLAAEVRILAHWNQQGGGDLLHEARNELRARLEEK